ncbi:unnamed protein product [Calypogeia fissa]
MAVVKTSAQQARVPGFSSMLLLQLSRQQSSLTAGVRAFATSTNVVHSVMIHFLWCLPGRKIPSYGILKVYGGLHPTRQLIGSNQGLVHQVQQGLPAGLSPITLG